MDGIFLRKKFNPWLVLLFLCGLFLIGLYVVFSITDSGPSGVLTFLVVGVSMCLVVIPSWLLNAGAFIHVDEESIKAKYHWFGKIDCKISEVEFAGAQINTLVIQLKDGKCHTITGIENSWEIAADIRNKITFVPTEQPEKLIEKVKALNTSRKGGLICVCVGYVLMFVIVFVTVFLTGERELYEFGKVDWIIFAGMCVTEIATIIATLYFALKTGRKNLPIEMLQYTIRRTIIETRPLSPGFVIAVYSDVNYTGRITLFGYSDNDSVYYLVQELDAEYNLVRGYESDTYESQDELPDGFEELVDITKKVLH